MTFLQAYEQNKSLYKRNKNEIFIKLLNCDYPINGRLIITVGVTEYSIFEYNIEFLRHKEIAVLDNLFEYVIAYRFID